MAIDQQETCLIATRARGIAEIDAQMKLLEFRMRLATAERRYDDRDALLDELAGLEIERDALAAE